jgi:hypothetical protein
MEGDHRKSLSWKLRGSKFAAIFFRRLKAQNKKGMSKAKVGSIPAKTGAYWKDGAQQRRNDL